MKTKLFTIAVAMLMSLGLQAQTAKNYKDVSWGNPISPCVFCADPTAIEHDGRLYVYGTNDQQEFEVKGGKGENQYGKIKSLVVFSTADMVNWTFHGTIDAGTVCSPWCFASWAPSIVAREEEDGHKHFYMYFSIGASAVGVLTAKSPLGPWQSPLDHPMIDFDTPGVGECVCVFDPGVVIDDEGIAWIAFGGGSANSKGTYLMTGNSRIAKLNKDMITIEQFVDLPAPYHFEANELNMMNGKYVLTYCTSGEDRSDWGQYSSTMEAPPGVSMCYMVTDNPLDPNSWEYRGDYVPNEGNFDLGWGNNHTHLHKFKENYYLFYQSTMLEIAMQTGASGFRSIGVNKAVVNENTQHINKLELDKTGVTAIVYLNPYELQQAETMSTSGGVSYSDFKNIKKVDYSVYDNDASKNLHVNMRAGSWTMLRSVDFGTKGANEMMLRAKGSGKLEVRLDKIDNSPSAVIEFSSNDYADHTTAANAAMLNGVHDVYLVFTEAYDVWFDAWQFIESSKVPGEFETAFEAVKNMKVGWNLWNTLESPGAEYDPTNYRSWETAWGNPVTKPELMKMMRKAGYNAIRLPVTWYPYTDEKGNVDSRWMARVHEVVDYVIDQGMYCILNVHHDTGGIDGESHTWIIADEDNYEQKHERFENIWRQIAEEFKDYDEHLLFEGYNEMVDIYNSWGDAFSWAVLLGIEPEYNEDKEQSIYKAVNKYAQSFVDVVRSTGGNNKMRNLIVNTYSGSDGKKPIKNLKVPDDKVAGHIAIQVHFYPEINEETANVITQSVSRFKAAIEEKNAPIIIGEWLMGEDTDDALRLSRYFMEQIRDYPIAPFIFGSCQGFYRSMPAFDHPEHVKEMMKGYYGDGYEPQLLTADDYDTPYIASFEEYDSELGLLTETSLDDLIGYRIDLAETPEEGKLEIIAIGEKGGQFQEVQSKSTTITFDKSLLGDKLTFLYMLSKHSGLYTVKVNSSVAIFRSKPYEKKIFGWNNNKCDVKYLFIRKQFVHNVAYNERWAELNIFYDDVPLKLKNYKGIRLELAEPLADAQVKVYGDGGQKEDYLPLTGVSTTISFNKEIFSSEINRVTLQNTQDGKSQAKVISAWLIRQDGTEEYSDLSLFHGCKITDITKYEGNSDAKDQYLVNPSFDHDLSGWTNTNGTARWKENTWEVLSNYCEFEWTGGPIANQEVVQYPVLPAGDYRLSVDCASDANNKGLYLVAGSNTKELLGADGINSFSLDFNVAEESKVKIGFKVENTTATWVNFDNFKLEKISSTAINSIKADDSHHAIIYNLSGQQLSKPQKGINIIGGQKVVVK